MKPHKSAKISHYDTGQPWTEKQKQPKSKKPVKIDVEEMTTTMADDKWLPYPGMYDKAKKADEPIQTVSFYTARATEPGYHRKSKTFVLDDQTYLVSRKTITVNPNQFPYGILLSEHIDFDWVFSFLSVEDQLRYDVSAKVKKYLAKPVPEPEPSLLILPKEFEEKRRNDLREKSLEEFLVTQITEAVAPVQKRLNDAYGAINKLDGEYDVLEKKYDAALEELGELRAIHKRTAEIKIVIENSRRFREED